MIIKSFCAHRGLSALVPENTLPAFAAAYALGADEIEFDVRLTCDGAWWCRTTQSSSAYPTVGGV